MERSIAMLVLGVYVRLVFKNEVHAFGMTMGGGQMQRGVIAHVR